MLYPINPITNERLGGIPLRVSTGGVVFKLCGSPAHIRADLSYKLVMRVEREARWFRRERGRVEFELGEATFPSDEEIGVAVNGAQ